MRKLILPALIIAAVWQYSQQSGNTSNHAASFSSEQPQKSQPSRLNSQFSCDGRQHCSQMTSRAEAVFFINHCPNTKMDGDNDGIPCENDSRF